MSGKKALVRLHIFCVFVFSDPSYSLVYYYVCIYTYFSMLFYKDGVYI